MFTKMSTNCVTYLFYWYKRVNSLWIYTQTACKVNFKILELTFKTLYYSTDRKGKRMFTS